MPYVLMSWALLTVVLFVQQAGKFSDIFLDSQIPSRFIWQLAMALVPSVVSFTGPMAVLVGVIIGLSKMQGDGELTAIRAAGVGNFGIALPVALVGGVLSLVALLVNLFGLPLAASVVRTVAVQAAIHKLESPIEPGTFNADISGYTVYVGRGDRETGQWKDIFIFAEEPKSGTVRLITSREGRVDASEKHSELVLSNSESLTLTKSEKGTKAIRETLGEVRLAIRTERDELIERLGKRELNIEELGLAELSAAATSDNVETRLEAGIIWQRRLVLTIAPLMFCVLGTVLVLRFNRGGKGFGIILALATLIGFYLIAFLGEQIVRTGKFPIIVASMLPISAAISATIWFAFGSRLGLGERLLSLGWSRMPKATDRTSPKRSSVFLDLTTGLRDFDILIGLIRYYVLSLIFLGSIFIIFTAFELWRFAGKIDGGEVLLGKYIFFLLPYVYLSLAPSAALISILATYVIKSRQNEIITWISSGQSLYRLLLPCFVLMLFLGTINWYIQESVAPMSNRAQDRYRNAIRGKGETKEVSGRYWARIGDRIYTFRARGSSNNVTASDNEISRSSLISRLPEPPMMIDLIIFEFDADKGHSQKMYRSAIGDWMDGRIEFLDPGRSIIDVQSGEEKIGMDAPSFLPEVADPRGGAIRKPIQMSSAEIREQYRIGVSESGERLYDIALQKRNSTIFLPFIIALFTAPFSLSLRRTGKVLSVALAIALWLVFLGVTTLSEQLGTSGMLDPAVAVWAPLLLFAALGSFLITRLRT